jgi:serine/threonine protein kinase
MPDAVTHPTPQELTAFGQGKLPDAAAVAVARHLEACPDCQKALEKVPPDSFVGKVRAAKPGGSSLPPGPLPAGVTRSALTSAAASSAPPADLPPELAGYGKYRIVRELGRGGMGVVYQAVQTVMDRPVAVKVMNPGVMAHPDALPRFQAEVKAAAKLDHAHIVRAHDAEQVGNLHLLVMEFVEGLNLADLVQRRGPLPVLHACHYVRQAALGLQHAFEQGMTHRDIKPQNLMLTPKGRVKILDFGLARLRRAGAKGGGLTEAGSFMGTPEYVSPEQATDARTADTRADIYSLGCTLFFLLTDRPPFQEDTVVKTVLAHIEKEPPVLHEVRPDVPPELSAVVARMLAKDPAQRFQQPVEVAQALVPFIKPGPKVRPSGAAPVPSTLGSAGKQKTVGGNRSDLRDLVPAAPKPAAQVPEPQEEKSPFRDLKRDLARPVALRTTKQDHAAGKTGPQPWWKRPMVLGGAGMGLLLAACVGLGVASVVRVRTADGSILVVDVNEPNAEIFLDGEKLAVTWDAGGKKAEISHKPGTGNVEVRKAGFTVAGREVELRDGKRVLKVTLIPASEQAKAKMPPVNEPQATGKDKGNSAVAGTVSPTDPDPRRAFMNRSGDWRIQGEELAQQSMHKNCGLAFGSYTWKDYDFSCEVKRVDPSAEVGLQYHGTGARASSVVCGANFCLAASIDRGIWTELKRDNNGLEQDRWYELRLRLRGDHCQCLLDGALILDYVNNKNPRGAVALVSSLGATAFATCV